MRKKLIVGILLLTLMLPCLVKAETRVYFSNEEINIAPGKTKTVDVIVDSDEDFLGASFNVITTSNQINFHSVETSNEFTRINGKGYNLTSDVPKKTGTKIASVTLKVSDSASVGTTGYIRLVNSSVTTTEKKELSINQVKVTVSNEKSNNNNLKSLTSSLVGIEFSSDKTEYNVTVPYDTQNFDLVATPIDNTATVNISDQKLTGNKTNITITVTAENGDKKEYKVIVTKEKKPVTTKERKQENNNNKEENKENYKSKWILVLISLLVLFILDIIYMKKKK